MNNGERMKRSDLVLRCDDNGAAQVMRFDAGSIGKLKRTPTGGVRVPGRVTRSGVFPYKRADGTTVREYRPADEVFHADSLASLADCAVTVAHPASGSVTPETFRRDAVGYVSGGGSREERFVAADLVVQDGDAIARIDTGDLVELSCGYACRLDMTPGVTPDGERYDAVQRGITYNHVALLSRGGGRAGRDVALRLDGAAVELEDEAGGTPSATENSDPTASKIARLEALVLAIAVALKIDVDVIAAQPPKAEPTKPAGEPAEPKSDAVEELVAETIKVREFARQYAPTIRVDGRPLDEIRREVLAKLDGAACVEGKSEAEVRGLFDGHASQRRRADFLEGYARTVRIPGAPVVHDAAPSLADKWRTGGG